MTAVRPRVLGPVVDDEIRCIHYRTPLDLIAIELGCCGEFYPCHLCSEAHEIAAINGGPVDVMLTHESPFSAVAEVQQIIDQNPFGFPAAELAIAASQRERVERVWQAVQPRLLVHGHMHVFDVRRFEDGRHVVSLACEGMAGNMVLLTMQELTFGIMPRSTP